MNYRFGPVTKNSRTRAGGAIHDGAELARFLPEIGNGVSRRFSVKVGLLMLVVAAILTSCSSQTAAIPPTDGSHDQFPGGSAEQNADWAAIVALEDQAKSIVRTDGCASAGDCKTAPVGSRACGGPRYYLVYCSRTTDIAALNRKLDQVAAAERAFNTKYQMGSTCEYRMPPQVGLVAGACSAK